MQTLQTPPKLNSWTFSQMKIILNIESSKVIIFDVMAVVNKIDIKAESFEDCGEFGIHVL